MPIPLVMPKTVDRTSLCVQRVQRAVVRAEACAALVKNAHLDVQPSKFTRALAAVGGGCSQDIRRHDNLRRGARQACWLMACQESRVFKGLLGNLRGRYLGEVCMDCQRALCNSVCACFC